METNSYISGLEMISDITPRVQDISMRWRSQGYYMRKMKQALEELAFDTLFDEQYIDTNVPSDLRIEMPSGVFNVRRIYAYNGDECSIATSKKVFYKRNYDTRGGGYTADEKDNVSDQAFSAKRDGREAHQFYGLRNGTVMLSESCRRYQKIRIYFNGVFGPLEDLPIIPILARQAVIEWTVSSICKERASEDPSGPWLTLYNLAKTEMAGPLGIWENTKYRLSRMDSGANSDFNQYLADVTNK